MTIIIQESIPANMLRLVAVKNRTEVQLLAHARYHRYARHWRLLVVHGNFLRRVPLSRMPSYKPMCNSMMQLGAHTLPQTMRFSTCQILPRIPLEAAIVPMRMHFRGGSWSSAVPCYFAQFECMTSACHVTHAGDECRALPSERIPLGPIGRSATRLQANLIYYCDI
jgi:hypothetical protein